MQIISHRGNLNGPDNSGRENSVRFIEAALDQGFVVEIDVWYRDNSFYLGHDYPRVKLDRKWFGDKNVICHAKNLASLKLLVEDNIHCFSIFGDPFTLTSNGQLWVTEKATNNICGGGIAVYLGPPDLRSKSLKTFGYTSVCTDYPVAWRGSNEQPTS